MWITGKRISHREENVSHLQILRVNLTVVVRRRRIKGRRISYSEENVSHLQILRVNLTRRSKEADYRKAD